MHGSPPYIILPNSCSPISASTKRSSLVAVFAFPHAQPPYSSVYVSLPVPNETYSQLFIKDNTLEAQLYLLINVLSS